MSFKFTKLEKKTFSKESSDIDENELEKEYSDEEKINQINNYQINNNLSSMLASQNIMDNEDNSLKFSKSDRLNINLNNANKSNEKDKKNIVNDSKKDMKYFQNDTENKNVETQFYELTTNGLVEKIKNDYEDIYMIQQNDINNFVEKLAKENSELKSEISMLKTEILKLKIKNEFNSKFDLLLNDNQDNEDKNTIIKKEVKITSEIIELEKKNIKEEYNYILNNISSNLISKNVKWFS